MKGLHGLCDLIESWLKDFKLKINASKAEVVSYGGGKSRGDYPRPDAYDKTREEYRYLGYIESNKSRAAKHMRGRSIKMKALNFFLGITEALDYQLRKRQIMAKACVETIGLYETEVMPTKDSYSGIKKKWKLLKVNL